VEVTASFPGLPSSLSSSSSSGGGGGGGDGGGTVLQSGQLISDSLEALRLGFLSCPARVVEPVYSCNLQCDQGQLGNLYAVLSRRRGVVVKEDVIDGTSLFVLTATVPLADSFGFAQELLKKTSGAATAPQMSFSHWQVQDTDPFWRATTEEELEEHGDTSALAAHSNPARALIDKVRKRKGQVVEEKVVASAEKQRTLNKKK
jgi:ribosome assembly protein 1